MAHSYLVHRMLAEFAAASVVFSKALGDSEDGPNVNDESEERITFSMFSRSIEGILQDSYPTVFHYYSRCLESSHKDFLWTGPEIHILSRSYDINSILDLTTVGELLDYPAQQIYPIVVDQTSPKDSLQVGKHRDLGDSKDAIEEHPSKRRRFK